MNKQEAADIAFNYFQSKGFDPVGYSSLGDARYLARPGFRTRIRVATYTHHHPDTISFTCDYREAWERDEQCLAWASDAEAVQAECDIYIADYEAEAEEIEEDE